MQTLGGQFEPEGRDAALGKGIPGQIFDYPEEKLVELLGACKNGRLYTTIGGQR
jgi:hypothetical protein